MRRMRRAWNAVQHGLAVREILLLVGVWKTVAGLGGGVIVFLFGLFEAIPITFLIPAALLAVGVILWVWNQIAIRKQIRAIRTVPNQPPDDLPHASKSELKRSRISDRRVRLVDVPRNGTVIANKTFLNCVLEGPVVLAAVETRLLDSGIYKLDSMTDEEAFEATVWMRAPGKATGMIVLENCRIINCWLYSVGLAMPPDEIDSARSGFGLPPRRPSDAGDQEVTNS